MITIILLFDTHRYDLLCLEGIAQALRIFNGKQEIPTYKVANISRESMIKMHVKPEVVTSEIHKFIIGLYFLLSATLILWRMNSTIFFPLQTSSIRPYVVCAVLRGITFDEGSYNSFIDLQDKLHQNICR